MEADFWHERWRNRQIGFHESEPNGMLVRNFDYLELPRNGRIFVPLCGKTLDIGWLLARGYRVCGIELSESAVAELFAELGVQPEIADGGKLRQYRAGHLDVFVGDFFALTESELGPVDAIYDRAALIALPEAMRRRYAAQMVSITGTAPQLLICLEYEQDLMAGPPFSVTASAVTSLYSRHYRIRRLESQQVPDGLKGQLPAEEVAWLLENR